MNKDLLDDVSGLLVEAAAKLSVAVNLLESEPELAALSQRVNNARYAADIALTDVRGRLRRRGR